MSDSIVFPVSENVPVRQLRDKVIFTVVERAVNESVVDPFLLDFVDDDQKEPNSLKRVLSRDGYDILTVTDPREGFKIVTDQKIGII